MPKTLMQEPATAPKAEPPSEGFSLISNEKLLSIFIAMVKCRMLEQRAATLFQQGKLDADLHKSAGREACATAVGIDLQPEDVISISTGDLLPAFVKGLPLDRLFRTLAPKIDGQAATALDQAPWQNIILNAADDSHFEHILERASTIQVAKKQAVVAAFIEPAADSLKRWKGIIASAAEKQLPIVFVHPAIDIIKTNSAATNVKTKAPQALFKGVPAIGVDALDPVALYRVAFEAIGRARQGRGATLLECAIVPTPVPASSEAAPGLLPDPVSFMETYLKGKGINSENQNREAVAAFSRDLDLATRFLDR